MKRKLGFIAAAVCLAASLAAFAACDDAEDGNLSLSGGASGVDFNVSLVFTASSEFAELGEDTSVKDYLDALVEADDITYEGYESDYGYYITSVNGIAEQISYTDTGSSGYSWLVYTNFLEEDGVPYANAEYGVYTYNGIELASASYGVSYLPCVEGYTYALVYEAWGL